MKQFKLRVLACNKDIPVFGITIPSKISEKYEGTFFSIKEYERGEIILRSGCRVIR